MKRVLIIKLGYSETLDSGLSLTASLGDVLRTTVILHYFKNNYVSWLADRKAVPLLENNKYIKRIWVYNRNTLNLLKKEKFDIVVNLEKLPEICHFCDSLLAKEYFGFSKYSKNSKRLIGLSQDLNKRRKNKDCWQKILSEALGKKWNGHPYMLSYKPKTKTCYDIGFNWRTSNKWKNKVWPKDYWRKLENLIKEKYSISWQQGLNSLYEYMDWINSCRLIITADTLGLHLSLALKRKVIALFGPTPSQEVYFYNGGSFLLPKAPYKCIPCLKPYCDKKRQCIKYITPLEVKERIEQTFKR
jgi:heptosyltransferase-2